MKKLSTIEKRVPTVSTFRTSAPVAAKRIVKQKVIDRNYGSIPHLSTSKMSQQADKKIAFGQEEILTKKARDWKDMIVLTEFVQVEHRC